MGAKGTNLKKCISLDQQPINVFNEAGVYFYKYLNIELIVTTVFFFLFFRVNFAISKELITEYDGYKYVITNEITEDESIAAAIEIYAQNSNKLLEKISHIPPEECEKTLSNSINDVLKSAKRKCFAFCQHDAQRRQTLYIMSEGKLISSINFDTSEPNLKWDSENNSFIALAVLRLNDTSGTASHYLVVYAWNPEVILMQNAKPTFNNKTYNYYYNYYQTMKEFALQSDTNLINSIDPMTIALSSTASVDTICRELLLFPLSATSPAKYAEINKLAEEVGFPTIDINKCKKGE